MSSGIGERFGSQNDRLLRFTGIEYIDHDIQLAQASPLVARSLSHPLSPMHQEQGSRLCKPLTGRPRTFV